MPKSEAFKQLLRSMRKTYLHDEVPLKYRKRYGKRYDASDVESFAYVVAKSKKIKID